MAFLALLQGSAAMVSDARPSYNGGEKAIFAFDSPAPNPIPMRV